MIHLNLSAVRTRKELHQYLKDKLRLPDYYGENLDALYDSLTESKEDRLIQVEGLQQCNDEMDGYGDKLARVLKAAEKVTESLTVELTEQEKQEELLQEAGVLPEDQALSFHRPKSFGLTALHEMPCEQGLFYREDGRPFLRLWMKNACNVELLLEQQKLMFLEVERNIWELSLDMEPGFYYVTLQINGVEVLNPFLPIGYGYSRPCNYLEIGTGEDFYSVCRVPHGDIRHEYFYSEVLSRNESCLVYTPPGYEKGTESYPVLYLQHGFGENETGWVWQGRIHMIMDNLLAKKKAVPMLIVMADGMTEEEKQSEKIAPERFTPFLLEEIIPYIEKKYRVKADREHRAMAGLSMGSMQTSMTAFTHPELFGWIGLFSGFMRNFIGVNEVQDSHLAKLLSDPEAFNRENRLFFRAMGNRDRFFNSFMQEDQLCEDYGIRQVRRVYEGAHDWNVWRRCAYEFLQLLFT